MMIPPMNGCPKCKSFDIEINTASKYFDIHECKICGYWTIWKIEDCCRHPSPLITIDRKSEKKIFLYRQCVNCGGSLNRTKPLSLKKYEGEIKSDFNISRFEYWKNEKEMEFEKLRLSKKNFDYLHSPRYTYYLYLISPEWKAKRALVLKRDNSICQKCLVKMADDIHHLTYENIGNENLSDLISVCRPCHEEIHRFINQ